MLKKTNKFVPPLCLIGFFLLFSASAKVFAKGIDCETDNRALRSMGKAIVTFKRADGSEFEVVAKLADTAKTRAAGFQRVCASTIAAEPILFVFQFESKPGFHMNNVVAAIDIAFIDKTGVVESIQNMQPYILISKNKPLYSPERPVVAALEGRPNFFSDHQLGLDSTVSWQRAE